MTKLPIPVREPDAVLDPESEAPLRREPPRGAWLRIEIDLSPPHPPPIRVLRAWHLRALLATAFPQLVSRKEWRAIRAKELAEAMVPEVAGPKEERSCADSE